MSQQKIADFFAEIGIKVSDRSLKTLTNNLEKIVNKLEKAESAGRSMSGILRGTSKAADLENKSIQAGNKVLAERQRRYVALNKVAAKVQKSNEKVGKISAKTSMFASGAYEAYRRSGPTRWVKATTGKMASAQWNRNFKESVGSLTLNSKELSSRAYNTQQEMYNKLFGAVDTSGIEKERAAMDKLHAQALREDNRRTKAAQNLARIQENVAKREQLMAERTAAIREAGAKRAAAIMHAAELRAQSMASRSSGGRTGGSGRGFSVMGGATVGGAIGSASSTAAGFLPGFGGAYALVNFNQIGQQLVALENAMLAVSESEQVAAERMEFLKEIGAEMGYTLRDIGPEFVKLAASIDDTALAGQEQGIFKSFMKYGTVMGLNPEEMKGSFRAVSQMINKQQVYAEELKGQLAERMPAAVKIAAKAMSKIEGRTVEVKELMKMMEDGKLDPNSLLPAMAEVMDELAAKNDAYLKALNTSATAQRRMNYQFEQFVGLFTKSGGEQAFAKIFNAIADFLKDNPKLAQGMANAMTKFATAMDYTMIAATNLINGLDQLGDSLGVGGTNLAIMIASAAVLSTHFGRIATAAYALFLILEDISVGMNGGDSYTKDFLDFLEENKWVAAAAGATAFAGALGMVLSQLGKIGTASKVLSGGAATGAAGGILSSLMRHPMLTGLTAGIGFTLAYSQSQLSEWGSTNKEGISQVSKGMTEFNDKRYAEVPVQTLLDRIASLAVQNQSVNIGDTTVHLTVTGLDPATQYDQIGLKIAEVFTNELLVASQNHVTGKKQ